MLLLLSVYFRKFKPELLRYLIVLSLSLSLESLILERRIHLWVVEIPCAYCVDVTHVILLYSLILLRNMIQITYIWIRIAQSRDEHHTPVTMEYNWTLILRRQFGINALEIRI